MDRLKPEIKELLFKGAMIPAYPLALNEDRSLDLVGQKTLTHYYIDAGVSGLAVGVHTTQFEIRLPEFDLYETVLRCAYDEIIKRNLKYPFIKLAGICGPTESALSEARLAREIGYDMGLLSLGGLSAYSETELIEHVEKIAQVIPVFGFYLQPSAGGRILSYDFWERFVEIEGVVAIKTAPFNRYQTLDVFRAVCNSKRRDDIAMYTGNDDNIVADLLTRYQFNDTYSKGFVGGLLGHWSVGTKEAVTLFKRIKEAQVSGEGIPHLLQIGTQVTDMNAAFFDTANGFKGCIAGINEVLARQGLLKGNWCLLDKECLSPNQSEEISRVLGQYPNLNDEHFIKENLVSWRNYANKT